MQNTTAKRPFSALALSASMAAAVLMAGCDKMETATRSGDKKVEAALVKADLSRDAGGAKSIDTTINDLKSAATISDAGLGGQVQGKSELARAELERALSRLPEIARRSQQIEVALWTMQTAGVQIQATQTVNAGYAKLEPKETLDQVEAARGEMTKSLEKAKADAAAAQAEIDKRQKEIDELKGQRTAAENEAEQLSQKSGEAKGKESVDLFRQASEARIKAGTLAAQIESKTAALLPFQRTVAIAQQQQQFWDSQNKDNPGALQQLDERKTQVQGGWQETQGHIQAMNDVAKKIMADTLTPKGDEKHSNAAAIVVNSRKENAAAREQVRADLQDAVKNYDAAATAAKKLRDELAARLSAMQQKGGATADKQTEGLKTLVSLYDENTYLLAKGHAEMALANVDADEANEIRTMANASERLTKALQGSNLRLAPELTVTINDVQAAVTKADAAYQAAEKTLNEVAEAQRNSEDLLATKNAGLVSLIGARYGRYLLTGDEALKAPIKLDVQKAKEAQIDLPPALRNFQ